MRCPLYILLSTPAVDLWACRICQWRKRIRAGKQVIRNCEINRTRNPLECAHLGDRVGDTDLRRSGCRSCPREASVWECEEHEYAVPFGRGRVKDAALRDCSSCDQYERK